jgi:hypothetical protein
VEQDELPKVQLTLESLKKLNVSIPIVMPLTSPHPYPRAFQAMKHLEASFPKRDKRGVDTNNMINYSSFGKK